MPRRLMALTWPWLFLLVAVPARAGFTITDLGALGDSSTGGIAGINSRGVVAGTVYGANGPVAVVSTPRGSLQAINLQGLPAGASYAAGVSDAGAVVGTYYNTLDRTYHAFQYVAGKATDIGPAGRANTYGVAVNASGAVAGTVYATNGTTTPFRTQGVSTTIALPDGSTVGRATGIGNAGAAGPSVVGSYMDARGTWHAFTIAGNQVSAIDPLQGIAKPGFDSNIYGAAINARGELTGYGDFNGQKHAFFVSGSTFSDIAPAAGFTSTRTTAMNDLGLVVGQMDGSGTLSHAFVWGPPDRPGQPAGLYDLNTLLAGPDRQTWTLTAATGINNGGQICGQGYVAGVLHGFVLTPPPDWLLSPATVPTPPSAVLAIAGLAIAVGWSRVRRGRTAGRGIGGPAGAAPAGSGSPSPATR